jgi:hypothetical protein
MQIFEEFQEGWKAQLECWLLWQLASSLCELLSFHAGSTNVLV